MPRRLDERHHALCKGNAFVGVIGNAERQQRIGKAHHAKSDLSRAPGHFANVRERIVVHVDDVIEEMDRFLHRGF
ncbi:hypothetical protein SDC9_189741 [bioreactor metagenome]|uniref:Uncharacterized protein n=1 Tax=bioreactor metagenome TaxID=1076179 RepID=A0A645HT08_9ZZZZ